MYGSYSEEDLNDWQEFPLVASVLTSSLFGAWLMRRDENKARQFPTISLEKVKQAKEEIEQLPIPNNATNGDIIKAMFDIEIVDDFAFSYGIKLTDSNYVQFNKDWWNAPYKAESEGCE